MDNLWYKNAVIYSLDLESFMDSNDDGIGDFKGLRHRLNYLSGLGVTCIWILPFYKTPNRDNGYDVSDYYQVDKHVGDLGHFAELVDAAEELGIRILIDLVVNHTSDQHLWFQEARSNKKSKYRDYYIWSEEKPEDDGANAVFGDSNWEYDEEAEAYFYHTFYPFQPDLNVANPEVQKEIHRIMHFWMKLGASGFRVDAAPHMVRQKGSEKFQGDPHDIFRSMRHFVTSQKRDAVLLAEVDVEPEHYKDFFGQEDQFHMLFNFYMNNYLFLALARQESAPIVNALEKLPECASSEQLANFVRNHDELDLERLSDSERQEVYEAFGPEENMRIFGRGIRRRVAPMLKNNRDRLELVYSLMLTLPGTPILRYGQEIAMGEDLSLEGRNSVRTIMQWSPEKNAGFSKASEEQLAKPIISKGPYSYQKVNALEQRRDPKSLLNWMVRAIGFRKESPEFGFGRYHVLDLGHPAVLAILRESDKGVGIAIHNFSEKEVNVRLELEDAENLAEVFGDKKYKRFDPDKQEIILSPYGYRWLRKRKVFL